MRKPNILDGFLSLAVLVMLFAALMLFNLVHGDLPGPAERDLTSLSVFQDK